VKVIITMAILAGYAYALTPLGDDVLIQLQPITHCGLALP